MTTAIVLGAGMVGSVMAADMAGEWSVTIADVSERALEAAVKRSAGRVKAIKADLSDMAAMAKLIAPFDMVLGALPSRFGFEALRTIITAKKNYCDITFMPQDAWDLDALAKQHGVTAVVDCGVAPGMSNMQCGYAVSQLDQVERLVIYVGGLPRERHWPFQYKAGFSPHDVIEEYVRPSRIVEHGKIVVKPALSEPELIDFTGVGTLEAFNTDGLRSLAHFIKAPFMKEQTLRYPGHIELMRAFRETGLFSQEPLEVAAAGSGGRVRIRPLDVISTLMFPKWTYEEGEEDLTVMRVTVEGTKGGKACRYQWDLLDFFDHASGCTSMSRTTAFPCTIVARMIAEGRIKERGVLPPEVLGRQPGVLDHVLKELEKRDVRFTARAS